MSFEHSEPLIPAPSEWNEAVTHSRARPTHVLVPYLDADGVVHVECLGSGSQYEPSDCGFTTEPAAKGTQP
jgi:hypothetical protein